VAAQNANIGQIQKVDDLAPYRVGVQQASVFQDWLEDELINTGKMASTNLFVYSRIDQGFIDLELGRLDLLVMDLPAAEVTVKEHGFKLAAQGLHREFYAIAMRKGENTLRTRINQALVTLAQEGVIDDLAKKYLDIDQGDLVPVPSPTPVPTRDPQQPTPTPLPGCFVGMAWVAELTHDDQNMTNPPVLQPGQSFQKGWRVRNTGTCTWDSSYSLAYVQGNVPAAQMGGQPVPVQGQVAPGATYDFYANLVAPLTPGTYQGIWQMRNKNFSAFGERIWVGIRVPAGPAPTAVPTQTPSPGINFTVDRTSITQGECVTFHWDVNNVKEVYFYSQGQNWQDHGVAGQGSRQECPSQTITYYLRVVKLDDSVEMREIAIAVQPAANAPNIVRFTIEPAGQIGVGQCVTLRWDVQGDVSPVKLLRNNTPLWDGAPFRGNYQDCPPGAGDMTYVIEASGPGGTSRATQHIKVVEAAATPTAAPTGVPNPVIDAFTVNPAQIQINECVAIGWSASGGTESVRLSRNGQVVQDNAGVSGSVQDCLSDPGTTTYVLEARNRVGVTVSSQASVQVASPVQPTDTPMPQSPVINSFTANPNQINQGECTILSWDFTGQSLAKTQIFRGSDVIASDIPSPSSLQDCPPGTGQVVYSLVVDSEFGGSARGDAVVQIAAPGNPLAGTRWQATAINGQPVLADTTLTAAFGADGSLDGSAGCNSYSTSYTVDGASLTIGPPSLSNMVCEKPAGVMEQEQDFLAALQSATAFSLEAGQLYVKDATGQAVIEFISY